MGIYFFCLNHLHVPVVLESNKGMLQQPQQQSSLTIFSVGFFARGLAAAAVMPFTVVKTRFEAGDRWYGNGIIQTLRGIARAEHPTALFRGFLPTILRDSPFSGVYLLLYSKSKAAIEPLDVATMIPRPLLNFCIGAFSGVFATILTNPPDVVRTRMQLRNVEGGGGMSVMHVVRSMYKNEGIGAFFHLGVLPRVVKRSVQAALTWTLYHEFVAMRLFRSSGKHRPA
ncbi:hypothetical protein GUITHDRAFT_108697 [Guillardia theta CCMP2712]|uniref:Mitochondrial carrier protein n=2 Tax=Guillardia theta TaxID=55529 RepID=L1JBG5_GUITC|nr:hypothetical protein GUITHDRAFT_108697 [Guillardia theta CCMP2712]EKX45430.1 hypothetical protein GUITHDRAFT_108697 [Guillardia theta CCMP2712]|eukprot:XP_005832410.1 hypothetical protein GUITHDRAFT_108697 [Guillardia theta CCMP2712]